MTRQLDLLSTHHNKTIPTTHPNLLPKSSFFTSANVIPSIRPFPSLVRSTVRSCSSTGWPSLVNVRSTSTTVAPLDRALRIPASVFSGVSARWATGVERAFPIICFVLARETCGTVKHRINSTISGMVRLSETPARVSGLS